MSWNVNGVGPRLPHVIRYLEEQRPDVLCLQETKVAYNDFPRASFEALGYHSALHSSGSYAGVAILSRHPPDRDVFGLDGFNPTREAGRRVACRIGGVWVDNVYVPTRTAIGKVAFLEALQHDHARRHHEQTPRILCGDFNICFDARDFATPTMIAQSHVHPHRPEDLALRRLLDRPPLVDCFRHTNQEAGHYSWFPVTPREERRALEENRGMRLDYIFASPILASRLRECVHDALPRMWDHPSDHLPVRATFDNIENARILTS